MAVAEVTEITAESLASDRCAAPSFRLRDWAASSSRVDTVHVAGGLVSDAYRLAPAKSFQLAGKGRWADELEDGSYTVSSLKSEPVRVHEAPSMVTIAQDALRACTTPLEPVRQYNAQVMLDTGSDSPTELWQSVDGVAVGLAHDFIRSLTDGADLEDGSELPAFFGRDPYKIRYRVMMNCGAYLKNGQRRELLPVLVERIAYGTATYANGGGRKHHEAGRWQAVLMPVRLGK